MFSSCYLTLTNVTLFAKFESSSSLLKIVKYCRDLEKLAIGDEGGGVELERSDILAIASLPRLKYLDIGACYLADNSSSALVRCIGLKELRINHLEDPTVLSTIGRNIFFSEIAGT
jgi:hypothetical protein